MHKVEENVSVHSFNGPSIEISEDKVLKLWTQYNSFQFYGLCEIYENEFRQHLNNGTNGFTTCGYIEQEILKVKLYDTKIVYCLEF